MPGFVIAAQIGFWGIALTLMGFAAWMVATLGVLGTLMVATLGVLGTLMVETQNFASLRCPMHCPPHFVRHPVCRLSQYHARGWALPHAHPILQMGNVQEFPANIVRQFYRFPKMSFYHWQLPRKHIRGLRYKWSQNRMHSSHNPSFVTGQTGSDICVEIYPLKCFMKPENICFALSAKCSVFLFL